MAPSRSPSCSRTWTRIQSQSRSHSQSQSRPITIKHLYTHAIYLTLLCALSSILNVTAQFYSPQFPSTSDISIIRSSSLFVDDGAPSGDFTYFDKRIANSFSVETNFGVSEIVPRNTIGVAPWEQQCSGIVNAEGVPFSGSNCVYQYKRSVDQPWAHGAYSEIFVQIPLTQYQTGTILNVVGNVSQIFEYGTLETHYIYVDYYRGPYNRAGNFPKGFFQPELTNNATTFLFRDVILSEAASFYPNYTKVNHQRPLPNNVTFAIIHYGVSSGPNVAPIRPHPSSIFDVKVYARKLETGPKVNLFYNGPTPASQTARVYISTSQCLRANNFTNSSMLDQLSITSSVPITGMNLSFVTSGAEQLYALDLTFPINVTGTVSISMPANRIYNDFADISLTPPVVSGNAPSNIMTLDVLTLVPSLTIYSPNYPVFPAAQNSPTIQYQFNFTTEVYGFDITRVGLCRTNYQNDTCVTSDYRYVTSGTNTWEFAAFGNVTGIFVPDPTNVRQYYTLTLTVPDGTYRVLVKRQDAVSGASENLSEDAYSREPIRVDTIRPTVVITPTAPNSTTDMATFVNRDDLIVFQLTFSELIASLNVSHLRVTNGSVGIITPITTAPNSAAPPSTWCNSINSNNTCYSQYTVQVNHVPLGAENFRETITLSYYPSDTVTAQSIVDLAVNPALSINDTSFPSDFRAGSIIFSNKATSVLLTVWPQDLLQNEFSGSSIGMNKTHLTSVRYNISFDYPVLTFNFADQAAAQNLTLVATRNGENVTVPFNWATTEKLDDYTFQSNLTYATNIPSTNFTIQLKPLSVADVAGVLNLASNPHQLSIDTAVPECEFVSYPPGLDRFVSIEQHSDLTNFRTLTYIFTFNEPLHPDQASTFATTFEQFYTRGGLNTTQAGTFSYTTNNNIITATYQAAADMTDNNLKVLVRLKNATDLYQNTATFFPGSCMPFAFQFDFDLPNMTLTLTDRNQFAPINSTHLLAASRYNAPITTQDVVNVTFQFDEAVNLTQAALLHQYQTSTTVVEANANITAFYRSNCDSQFGTFCNNFIVTLRGQDASYSIIKIDPSMIAFVTDIAGNSVINSALNLNFTFLTDQNNPSVALTTSDTFTNRPEVRIDLLFTKHIAQTPGNMTGSCFNTSSTGVNMTIPLPAGQLVYIGTNPAERVEFYTTFNVSAADLMTCEFRIGPNDVFDLVGNTLVRTYSLSVQTRFAGVYVTSITSPRGWLTNDLNPIPFCITTDIEAVLHTPEFGGSADALNQTSGAYNRPQISTTVPLVYDAILGTHLPTQNRTYNATTRTYCADIIPTSTSVTDIRIEVRNGTLHDVFNNTNSQSYTYQIRRFDLNPHTYDNLVTDGIIENQKLANNSVSGRNIQDGTIETRHIANNSITFDKLVADAVRTINILNGSITTEKIAREAIVDYLMSNNSIETRDIKERAITTTKIDIEAVTGTELANNSIVRRHLTNSSIDSSAILDGTIQQIDLANNSVGEFQLQNGSINTHHIKSGGISEILLGNNSISYRTIASASIDSTKIIPGSITTESLSPHAIASINFQNHSILNQFIALNAINSSQIQSGAVETHNIAIEAVETQQLGWQAVTADKIQPGAIARIHFTKDLDTALASIELDLQTIRKLDYASAINNASLHGYKLANGAIGTQQIHDAAVTQTKIAENAVTWRHISPKTINSDNLGDSSVLGVAIAYGQIAPHHLVPDFFTNNVTNVATSLTAAVRNLATDNFAPGSINAATVIQPATVTNELIVERAISLRKLDDSGFNMFVNMYNRLAQLETQMTTLLNNIDSRCIFNTTFTVANPPPVTRENIPLSKGHTHTPMHTSSIEHYMSIHPDLVEEIERRATDANTPRAFHTAQVNTVNKYPATIVDGAKYCGDGAGKSANNNQTQAPDNDGVILNQAANINPSTLVMAVAAMLLAAIQL